MRFVDEFRDPALGEVLAEEIRGLVEPGRHYKFMEVCGGHTHSIYKYGIDDLLPANVELVHGPGCPVCVIPMGRVDDAIALAHQPDVIFTCFGDMLRVPGSDGTLLDAKAEGADIRMVYSPLDALRIAKANPERPVVFYAIGFETTAPSTALTLKRAKTEGVAAALGGLAYHAGMSGDDRSRVQDEFLSGRVDLICATVAFGMGIDKADVRLVVHYLSLIHI